MSDVIVGIDLGTTNSLVAICENGNPRVLKSGKAAGLVSSVVHWPSDASAPSVGLEAKKFRVTDPAHTAYSVKRFIGRGKQDINRNLLTTLDTAGSTDKNVLIKLGERSLSAIELSAEILKELKKIAETSLGTSVNKAVVTVPAYFNDSQRSATKAAGQLAGLDVVRIVNEPTAAALAYGLDKKKNGLIAVYDLGGGTFDVSILKLHDGIFEVLSTNGDTALGGDDFDQALFETVAKKLGGLIPSSQFTADLELKATLLEVAEKIKIELSTVAEARLAFTWKGKSYEAAVKRNEFNKSIEPLIDKTVAIAKSALEDAKIKTSQIDDVVMVGGSTRIPLVREKISAFFGKEINVSLNPDEVVALGAAIQADILAGHNTEMVLLDIVPLSLGIETYGGTIGKIIHRNSKIPCMAKETFTTHVEGQRNVLIHVLQGERELANDCRSLARFDLRGLPPMPAGLPKIEVIFLVDANGILKVKAKELTTGTAAEVEVRPTYGLTDEQVEQMLNDSFTFAEDDMRSRQLIDTRVQAEGVLKSAEKILNEARTFAPEAEILQVRYQLDHIRQLIKGSDYIAIKDGLEKLEDLAKPLAAQVMDAALKASLNKKHVDDVVKKN
jgi:Fe-S protein assembly chaperone HscA